MSSDFQITPPSRSADAVAAFALTTPDHRMIAVNDAFAQLLGYAPAELCGRTFESITFAPDADIDSDLAERLFAGRIASYEIAKRYEHKSGQLVKILLLVSTVSDASGRIAYAISQVRPLHDVALTSLPQFQHPQEPSEEIEKIKRAMFW